MHSGTNPSPGLGIARSLRTVPGLRIIGLDYSPTSSGLHSELLDGRIVMPGWDEIDLPTWVSQLSEYAEEGAFLSSLDLEVRLIASELPGDRRFLSPDASAMEWVSKPPTRLAEALGVEVVESLAYAGNDVELGDFLRRSFGGVWVKGQHYEAFRAFDLAGVLTAGEYVASLWGAPWHVERHFPGQESGIAFVARDGQLVDCVQMRKTLLTAASKTWSGNVSEVEPKLRENLAEWVHESQWHGGGELELIESWAGDRVVLMEINPRLPAWIHGATVAHRNLPRALVLGEADSETVAVGGFTRVVEEIPSHSPMGTPAFPWSPEDVMAASTKHPSGMPAVAKRLLVRADLEASADERDLPSPRPLATPEVTPQLRIDSNVLAAKLADVRDVLPKRDIQFAYSVKTNPSGELMKQALAAGMLIEVISQDEMRAAIAVGAQAEHLVLNGPAKWWPQPGAVACKSIFMDSVPEFAVLDDLLRAGSSIAAEFIGLRLSRSGMRSRFGINADSSEDIVEAARLLLSARDRLGSDWGVHFHAAQSSIGMTQWVTDCLASLRAVDVLADVMGSAPGVLDFGGGWHARDLDLLPLALAEVVDRGPEWITSEAMPWIFELGKSLVEPCGELFTRVIVAANRAGDVVVDAGVADLPEGPYWPHPISIVRDGVATPLQAGGGRVLGRTCMERDVLGRGFALDDLAVGDVLVFEDAGGYDSSMSYEFGRGISREWRSSHVP